MRISLSFLSCLLFSSVSFISHSQSDLLKRNEYHYYYHLTAEQANNYNNIGLVSLDSSYFNSFVDSIHFTKSSFHDEFQQSLPSGEYIAVSFPNEKVLLEHIQIAPFKVELSNHPKRILLHLHSNKEDIKSITVFNGKRKAKYISALDSYEFKHLSHKDPIVITHNGYKYCYNFQYSKLKYSKGISRIHGSLATSHPMTSIPYNTIFDGVSKIVNSPVDFVKSFEYKYPQGIFGTVYNKISFSFFMEIA